VSAETEPFFSVERNKPRLIRDQDYKVSACVVSLTEQVCWRDCESLIHVKRVITPFGLEQLGAKMDHILRGKLSRANGKFASCSLRKQEN
jgi:hypothetical protein